MYGLCAELVIVVALYPGVRMSYTPKASAATTGFIGRVGRLGRAPGSTLDDVDGEALHYECGVVTRRISSRSFLTSIGFDT